MNHGKYVFAQLSEFYHIMNLFVVFPNIRELQTKKTFTCWCQLLFMIFSQLSNQDSLHCSVLWNADAYPRLVTIG